MRRLLRDCESRRTLSEAEDDLMWDVEFAWCSGILSTLVFARRFMTEDETRQRLLGVYCVEY